MAELEERLREALLSWEDELQQALLEECGEARGNALFQRYQQAFPVAYRDDFKPRVAVHDILRLESVGADQPLVMHLYRVPEDPERLLRFKLFGREHIALSAVLPMLEKLGLRVLQARPYEIAAGADTLWILGFDMVENQGVAVDVVQVKENFQAAFAWIWSGAMESDGFNRLVLGTGLNWREVVMLRAYGKYLLQARAPFSQAYMEQTLGKHPAIASYLAELFQARFDPRLQLDQGRRTTVLGVAIEEALEQVPAVVQIAMLLHSRRLLERACLWLLRHRRPPLAIDTVIDQFSAGIAAIRNRLPDLLKATEQAELQAACQRFGAAVPAELAQWVASMDALYCALDLVEVSGRAQLPVETVGAVYFDLVNRLELNWLRRNIIELPTTSHWQNRARAALLQGLYDQGRLLTAAVLPATDNTLTPPARLDAWMA